MAWLGLYNKKYFWSGVFFSVSAVERIFPIFFFAGALLFLLGDIYSPEKQMRKWSDQIKKWFRKEGLNNRFCLLIFGFISGFIVIFTVTTIVYGLESWTAFAEHIREHSGLYFTNHIGLKKVAVYSPDIFNTTFSVDIPERFAMWTKAISSRWATSPLLWLTGLGLIILAAYACIKTDLLRSSLFWGSVLLFVIAMPAHYYHIYFGVLIALLLFPDTRPLTDSISKTTGSGRMPWNSVVLWIYVPFAVALQTSNIFYIAEGNEARMTAYISMVILSAFIMSSVGILCRFRNTILLFSLYMILLIVFLGLRSKAIANDMPPDVFGQKWKLVTFKNTGSTRIIPRNFVDVCGNSIQDTALVVENGKKISGTFMSKGNTCKEYLIRTDRFYSGTLELYVNNQLIDRRHLNQLGFIFDYIQIQIPAEQVIEGDNTIELKWLDGIDVGVFSTWIR